ncbi:phage baseplate plug family protein [Paenibacillus sp. 481]|uniref:phage baseplate plug family protein n=1 Tax=Paenibacillus sp. 481 TaxID=2835869 RepID=UPI001E43DD98|nr:hypothetical protein [Paenibacillus sp. 481]UHA71938.1 hypothetical protein KIK04_14490 [Paenibacillus sp. 481]
MAILTIDKELIPYSFDIEIGQRLYTMELRYNARHDYFTVDLSGEHGPLVLGAKLNWGVPLFDNLETADFPNEPIIAEGIDGHERISWDALGETVQLRVGEDDGEFI